MLHKTKDKLKKEEKIMEAKKMQKNTNEKEELKNAEQLNNTGTRGRRPRPPGSEEIS